MKILKFVEDYLMPILTIILYVLVLIFVILIIINYIDLYNYDKCQNIGFNSDSCVKYIEY